ncbi:protein PIN-LIKES 7 [Citrus sinensis]|uniref:Protein PIN-LIKES 7 n=1 Tax=Citrus sinensis TaxID=2711 RepID=A0ACB8IYD3_CITSI|nr:protein PIN-LIKES 7 [Citrus sinensis]
MGFWTFFEVASMPIVQVLLISVLGALMATQYWNLLTADARRSLNKMVFTVFTPSLMFASLAKTVTLEEIISWWFMPVNVAMTFLIGGILGWIVVKLLRPKPHLEGLVIATCASGNLGNLLLIIVPAICHEQGSPFGNRDVCSSVGLSYASFSMAASHLQTGKESFWKRSLEFLHQLLEELLAPPTLAAIVGFIFGAVVWLRNLIIGDSAPLRVIQDSIEILGDGTIPCITLILGGNLIQGLRSSTLKPLIIIAVVCVRYVALPFIGVWVVKAAAALGFLPSDPLYHYVLMVQFTLPPAMNIGTMTQLFDVAQEECSVLFLWTYLVAALALTGWSMVYMWILS